MAITANQAREISPTRTAVAHATVWRGYAAMNLTYSQYILMPWFLWATFGWVGVDRAKGGPWR